MSSIDPFDDSYQITRHGDDFVGKAVSSPSAMKVPIIQAHPTLPCCNRILSSSTNQAPLPSSPPLAWTAADFGKLPLRTGYTPLQGLTSPDYLLAAIFPDQMVAGEVVLEQHIRHSEGLAGSFRIELYLRTKSQPAVSASAYSATAPIGSDRPITKVLIAEATGEDFPAARKALAERIFLFVISPTYVMMHHIVLSHLYRLPVAALLSVRRGMEGMGMVTENEWMGRLMQLQAVKIDTAPWSEARLEIFLLENGLSNLMRWTRLADMALVLEQEDRDAWADTHSNVAVFLERIVAELDKKNL